MAPDGTVTVLLKAWRNGEQSALDRLTPLIYTELRRIARAYLRSGRASHTLVPTALVNEAYIRLLGGQQPDWQDRKHFFGVAARVMRQILVDHARRRRAGKPGNDQAPLEMDALKTAPFPADPGRDLLDLDDALQALQRQDPRKSQAVELRFFGGLTLEEIAGAMELSPATVHRELKMAQAWLARELRSPQNNSARD